MARMTPPMCDLPPAGWFCTRRPHHKGICRIVPRLDNPSVYVPTEALARLRGASLRHHEAARHVAVWEHCDWPSCTEDRAYLGRHGIVGSSGRKLR
jgi:hypothetical protein